MAKATLGLIVGNRDFFPSRFVTEGRNDLLQLFKEMDIEAVVIDEKETNLGGVETRSDAKICGELFKKNVDKIEGVLVILPNFGNELGIAETLRISGLNVPVLVQAYPDDVQKMSLEGRRDSFCGKFSACNVLRQYGYAYSLTANHTVHPKSESFRKDLEKFVAVCKVVKGLKKARLGAIGARPDAFKTVRFSEKLFERSGISVSTVDLSEIIGNASRLKDTDSQVVSKLDEIKSYVTTQKVPAAALLKMAKLGLVIENWMNDNDIDATAIQCWESIQKNYGVNVCGLMSMMGEKLLPSACEVDVAGVLGMYALTLASGKPSALVDWNNNYGDDPNKCVLFHCGNFPKSFFDDKVEMYLADVLGTTLGNENVYGALAGRIPSGPLTYARVSTDDVNGKIRTYFGEGRFTDDELPTFGGRGVIEIPNMQALLQNLCKGGFEHHVGISRSHVAGVLEEAFGTYLGWEVYYHKG
ncbi:MAG: fucose isomerase [Chloroflexi bacterium]|nr:fucose isomerase [Chloroflexota bacterium]